MSLHDELATWVAERQSGPVTTLRTVCDWVGDRTGRDGHHIVDDLQALGYVDVRDGRFQATSPALSLLADSGGNGLLVGARPRWLQEVLEDLDSAADLGLGDLSDHVIENLQVAQDAAPTSWYLSFGPEGPLQALEKIGVRVRSDMAGALLRRIEMHRPHELVREVQPGELAGRLDVDHLSRTGDVVWQVVQHDRDPGVYRYMRNRQRVFAVRSGPSWVEQSLRWAAWTGSLMERGLDVDLAARRLTVRGRLRLPVELERVLVLRTGRLPSEGPSGRVYQNITYDIACRVGALVGKEPRRS